MELLEVKQKFIELRAQGWSFDKIAKELKKSKQVLIDWSRDLEEEISNIKALELELLYEKHYLGKESRIRSFGEILGRIETELASRSLSGIPTDKLMALQLKYRSEVRNELTDPTFKSSAEIARDKSDRQLIERLIGATEN